MDLLFLSKRLFLGNGEGFINGGVVVDTEGIIRKILYSAQEVNTYLYNTESEAVFDFENLVLMPGLIDANVHISEPGRKDWEGFVSANKAAAAGGFTTIIDGPINSIPATTNVSALKSKINTARGKIYIDVGFWGGLVKENLQELKDLTSAGVIGMQCTLCPSAEPVGGAFSAVTKTDLETVIPELDNETLLGFHAELTPNNPLAVNTMEPKKYTSFADTRPKEMEVNAVQLIAQLANAHKSKHLHILNISSADVLPIIQNSRAQGAQLTADTCPHYLTLAAEQIEDCHTEFKTHPPIRNKLNQQPLWDALKTANLDMITTHHSPATPGVKCLTYGRNRGDFLNSWPGICSLQLSLPVVWTQAKERGLEVADIYRLMCKNPALICGIHNFKGKIAMGYDADFCIWDPDEEFTVTPDLMYSSNKVTPYTDQKLMGVVHATVVRGLHVYQKHEGFGQPLGRVILKKTTKNIVKFVRM